MSSIVTEIKLLKIIIQYNTSCFLSFLINGEDSYSFLTCVSFNFVSMIIDKTNKISSIVKLVKLIQHLILLHFFVITLFCFLLGWFRIQHPYSWL